MFVKTLVRAHQRNKKSAMRTLVVDFGGDCVKKTVRWTVFSTKREQTCLRSGSDRCRTPDPLISSKLVLWLHFDKIKILLFARFFLSPKTSTMSTVFGDPTTLNQLKKR